MSHLYLSNSANTPKKMIEYDFQATTDADYICYLTVPVSGQKMSNMFQMALKKAGKKEIDLDNVEQFIVPHELLRGINYAVKPMMKKVKKQLDVTLQSWNVTKAEYIKMKDDWRCKITIEGYYAG